jgi:hypothetical protein
VKNPNRRGKHAEESYHSGIAGWAGTVRLDVFFNVILGFQVSINMKKIEGERQVYEMLKEHIVVPGRYICNPELTAEGRFPDGKPVFSILYGGVGHESAGRQMMVGLAVFFIAPMIGAWMLSQTSGRVISSYPRKVLFFAAIGLLFAVFTDMTHFGIGSYPVKDAIVFAMNNIVAWTLTGCALGFFCFVCSRSDSIWPEHQQRLQNESHASVMD